MSRVRVLSLSATAALFVSGALIWGTVPDINLPSDRQLSLAAQDQSSFVNWESPHVSPIDITPDGSRLLVVNTADNRLEVFEITEHGLSHGGHLAAVPVGLDPVSVRARTNDEAWVVNRISNSISIVNLDSMTVSETLGVGYEPNDVVFAGPPESQRAFVSVAEFHEVKVYDPANLAAPPTVIPIQGREPRMLATDGERVYVPIFESGSRTTILKHQTVSEPDGPYGGQNPPPNDGDAFNPPIVGDLPEPPPASLIVRRENGIWLDDNNADWSEKVTWDLHDHGVAIIRASTLDVGYVAGTMNINMALAVNPASGNVTVVGTDATNWIRFEPNINGVFLRVNMASFNPAAGGKPTIVDLNPHLDYASSWLPWELRQQSIGDPRAIVWNSAGTRGYVAGMGSNNVIIIDASGKRLERISIGRGPTGLVLDEARQRLYALNRFDGNVSVIDTTIDAEINRVQFYDPTPAVIRDGRPFLYDTHLTSGLGHVSCASCHVDGRSDRIAWDLGNPQGAMIPAPEDCGSGFVPPDFDEPCPDFRPMKGPMVTQTLIGIIDNGRMHWRGDRENLHAFDVAFTDLQAMDAPPSKEELDKFEAFIGTLRFPANPNLTFFNQLQGFVPGLPGNSFVGVSRFDHVGHVNGGRCTDCHLIPPTGLPDVQAIPGATGTNGLTVPTGFLGEVQTFKTPHLRDTHKKAGFDKSSQMSDRGFGFLHDGSDDTILAFLDKPGFNIGGNHAEGVEAFLHSFPTETHRAIGTQVTLTADNANDADVIGMLNDMQTVANQGHASIVAKGFVNGEHRGFAYIGGGVFQSDRADQTMTMNALRNAATAGAEITITVVPPGSEIRIGIDRDEDGYYDRDELDAGSDPADPHSTPKNPCPHLNGDLNGDCVIDGTDLLILLSEWGKCGDPDDCPADLNGDGVVDGGDLLILLANWG
jgi:DNA-binding beta-propeller fold protein YncE